MDVSGKAIPLRQPLVQLYVKSGDVTLARLPVVPGISPLEKADLSDDSRRLEAEAFMRGFQGEILDLIGLRALLSTRINRLVAQNKMKEAEKALNELRALKDYSGMVEGLDKLQRKVLDESNGPISLGAKSRIDRLFQSTREMMQKFLQNDLVRDAETTFSKGQAGKMLPQPPVKTPPPPKPQAMCSAVWQSSRLRCHHDSSLLTLQRYRKCLRTSK